ncbi:MAG: hypothetical protein AAGF77_04675 [Bacteroidota bacterium]
MNKKPTYAIVVVLATLMAACSAYRAKKQEALLQYPDLGAIVKTQAEIGYRTVTQVGAAHWDQLQVTVQQLPFNPESYLAYAKAMQRAKKINTIPYQDSLPYGPKYVRLQLMDKIALTNRLNDKENTAVLTYLEKDPTLSVVTSLDVALTEEEISLFKAAQRLILTKDKQGNTVLEVAGATGQELYYFSELPIFRYGCATFCWGEDRYHRKRIENIAPEGTRCPKGTFAKPRKVKGDKKYVKL